jgi:hypothetical protein
LSTIMVVIWFSVTPAASSAGTPIRLRYSRSQSGDTRASARFGTSKAKKSMKQDASWDSTMRSA